MDNLTHGGDIYSLLQKKNILDFSTNINPLGIHSDVQKAVADSIGNCVHYPDPLCRELTKGIAEVERVVESCIACGNGAADIIWRLVQTMKPKRALLPVPTFSEYESALRSVGCETEHFHMGEKDGFMLTERILEIIRPGIDIMFICNPNNPTGLLASPELMLWILDSCAKNGVLLVVDECFNGFLDEPKAHSLKRYLAKYQNLVLLKAFTKLFAIPGLRLGYGLCADINLMDDLRHCGQAWSVSIPAQAAGIAALKLDGYAEQTREMVSDQREWLKVQLRELGFIVYNSVANYVFVKCGADKLKEYLIGKDILIRSCENYLGLGSGYYRFAVLDEQANQKLVKALKDAIRNKEITI